jgi:hypothetical protein
MMVDFPEPCRPSTPITVKSLLSLSSARSSSAARFSCDVSSFADFHGGAASARTAPLSLLLLPAVTHRTAGVAGMAPRAAIVHSSLKTGTRLQSHAAGGRDATLDIAG